MKIKNEIKCQTIYITVMKSLLQKTKFNHDKLKTLCTLDTSDIVLNNEAKQLIDRTKHNPYSLKQRKNSRPRQNSRHQLSISLKKNEMTLSNEKYHNSIIQTRTINTQKKIRQELSKIRQRIKTDYNYQSPKKIVLKNLQIFTVAKNVKFHMDEQYNVDPFYITNTIKSTKQQTVYTVKYLSRGKKEDLYILRKSNHPKTVQKYQGEIEFKEKLTDRLKSNQKKNLSCIYKTYCKDQQGNMFLAYHMEGEPLSWKKPLCKKLIQNLQKNNMEILKHLVVELSKAIHILSLHGYYHSELRLKSVLVKLKEDDENVKVSKLVKLGNLSKCLPIKDKKSFQSMPHSIYTPPEILNFIIFENQNKNFNRSWLDYIYMYENAWRISVWSLGILVLELLNGEPLANTFISISEIVEFQKHLQFKCAYLFDKIDDQQFEKLLKKMLSTNPQQRPSPEQVILCLTS